MFRYSDPTPFTPDAHRRLLPRKSNAPWISRLDACPSKASRPPLTGDRCRLPADGCRLRWFWAPMHCWIRPPGACAVVANRLSHSSRSVASCATVRSTRLLGTLLWYPVGVCAGALFAVQYLVPRRLFGSIQTGSVSRRAAIVLTVACLAIAFAAPKALLPSKWGPVIASSSSAWPEAGPGGRPRARRSAGPGQASGACDLGA